jgi:hypothetical protein
MKGNVNAVLRTVSTPDLPSDPLWEVCEPLLTHSKMTPRDNDVTSGVQLDGWFHLMKGWARGRRGPFVVARRLMSRPLER